MKSVKSQAFAVGLVGIAVMMMSMDALAQMTTYKSVHYPTALTDEIVLTGSGNTTPANTNTTSVASGLMGALYFSSSLTKSAVLAKESVVRSNCPGYSNSGNTWPGACDIKGLSSALNSAFGQAWVPVSYNGDVTGQNTAINKQVDSLKGGLRTPVIVPIYGSTDHMVTVWEIRADTSTSPYSVQYVKYFDGGTPGPNAMDPWTDAKGNTYYDGVRQVAGAQWKTEFYILLSAPPGCNPYCGKYVLSYDPPPGNGLPDNAARVHMARFPSVLAEGEEMDPLIAEERVWDALYLAGIPNDPMLWQAIEHSFAGAAYPVYGEDLDGQPMDYYVVPLVRGRGGAVVAMVRLSMADGSLEAIWVPTRPIRFLGVTPQEASYFAHGILASDEQLVGGELTWQPNRNLDGSDMMPHYQYYIVANDGEFRGEVGVSLVDGRIRGLDQSLAISTAIEL